MAAVLEQVTIILECLTIPHLSVLVPGLYLLSQVNNSKYFCKTRKAATVFHHAEIV